MNLTRRKFLLGSLGLVSAWPLAARADTPKTLAVPPAPAGQAVPTLVSRATLPPKPLRGYGALSAVFDKMAAGGGPASVLTVGCVDAGKASLTQAKFLSDLLLLPGAEAVTLQTPSGALPAVQAKEQGFVTAMRIGKDVIILSATTSADLDALHRAHKAAHPGAYSYTSETNVPMWLDRWDKHGFLFYSYTWQGPPADYVPPAGFEGRKPGYDYGEEFHWAKANDVGFIFWNSEAANDLAEGMMNDPWIDWAIRGTTAANLPVHINTSSSPTTWLLNRYREDTQRKMPQYSGNLFGPGDPEAGGQGLLSWNSQEGADAELGVIQSAVRKYAGLPNVVGWLEPHGETVQSAEDFMSDYGPVADRAYRRFLKEKYQTVSTVNARWHGDEKRLHDWNDVHVPEFASFLGWGPDALDLTGQWRIAYEANADGTPFDTHNLNGGNRGNGSSKTPTQPAPDAWFAPDFDDSAWPSLRLPGNDRIMFTPNHPAVFRTKFILPAAWKNAHPKIWLYAWEMKEGNGTKTAVYLNGVKAGEYQPQPQWAKTNYGAFDVTEHLIAGENHLALRQSAGAIDYRIYLSPRPPKQYPLLGPHQNAQWVDFADWQAWSRAEMTRRSADMFRQVDPNRNITQMAPAYYSDVLKPVLEDYGGQFHDTGYMGGFYADYNPTVMRGSNLPFDAEPGGPADTPLNFLHMMGLYLSEGVQGVSYFINIGDVMWRPNIREKFEDYLPLYHMIGKYHLPKAEFAMLYDDRVTRLLSNPWGQDYNVTLSGSYWSGNMAALLGHFFDYDGVTGPDFSRGHAGAYKVIVDSNTSIMDDERISEIEKYVRDGGMFITFSQTGRHTPTHPDTWPISRLTGYKVTHINKYNPDGQIASGEWHQLRPAPGQTIFIGDKWKGGPANGQTLQKTAADCQDLLLWDDGTVAVGMRPLGKGVIVHVGAKSSHAQMFDRDNEPHDSGGFTYTEYMAGMYAALLDWRGVRRLPGSVPSPRNVVLMRHYVTNNGLHDVWTLWNQDREKPVTADLLFAAGLHPASATDVRTGESVPITRADSGDKLAGLTLEPMETRMFLTPRGQIETAALDWLTLQRGWWQGTASPSSKVLPTPEQLQTHTLALTETWAFHAIDGLADTDIVSMAQPGFDDSAWEKRPFGVWSLPDHRDVKQGLLRRHFTVPAHWKTGTVGLWLQSWVDTTFVEQGRVYLDGKMVRDFNPDGMTGDTLAGALTPGSHHVLAVEIKSNQPMAGARGHAWLTWWPAPQATQDLAGQWIPSRDGLHEEAPITLPGPWDTMMARRVVPIAAAQSHRNVIVAVSQQSRVTGVIINGFYLRRHHHAIGPRTDLNITPWVRFGEDNEIVLVWGNSPGTAQVNSVALHFYDKGVYP